MVKSYIFVKQYIVFPTLLWLNGNNILYNNIVIDYKKIANWINKFMSRSIKDNIILNLLKYFKLKSYIHDLSENNLENKIYIAISNLPNHSQVFLVDTFLVILIEYTIILF